MIHRLVHWFIGPPDEAPPFAAAILDRFPIGTIFLIEGVLKFHSPQEFGVGRFIRIGIPLPHFFLRRLTEYLKSDAELCFCLASLLDRL